MTTHAELPTAPGTDGPSITTGDRRGGQLVFHVQRWKASIPFHGVLAPNAKLRPEIVPNVPVNANTPSADHAEVPPPAAPAPMNWARLLKRMFEIDLEHCPHCGGPLTIIAAIEHPPVIAKILAHLGLAARAPPRAPARAFDRFHLAF